MSVTPQLGVQVFDAHPDAHWLLDDRGVLKHANKAALRLMGNLATVPAGEKISNLVVDEATRCEDLIRQGLRSTVSLGSGCSSATKSAPASPMTSTRRAAPACP